MKKKILILALLLSPFVYGQGYDFDLQISLLSKFAETQEKVCSTLDTESSSLSILYKNGISAYIRYTAYEDEHAKGHNLSITYFIPKMNLFVENKNDRREILTFIKQKINKNDFVLSFFFNEAFGIALYYLDESLREEVDGFSVFAVNPDWSSELVIRIRQIWGNQYVVSIRYFIAL